MTPAPSGERTPVPEGGRRAIARVDIVLYAVALLLACGVVVLGVLVVRDRADDSGAAMPDSGEGGAGAPGVDGANGADGAEDDPQAPPSVEEQDRYGDVLAAAKATATALVNIDYRNPQRSFDAVATTATGTFLDQYRSSSQSLVRLVKTYKSVLSGSVVTAAVSDVDADSATVLVATEGKVTNAETAGDEQVRNFRLLVRLVKKDDAWLTNDLEFVG